MRVTGSYYSQAMINQLNTLSSRQYKLQNQISTGQKVSAPEDDPAAVQRSLALRTEQKTNAQYQSNIATLKERSTASFNSLTALKKLSDRAGEIATLADGTRSPEELQTYGNQITQIIKQAVDVMNGQHNGQYLFGGTKTDAKPFTIATNGENAVTAVTYNGNATASDAEIDAGATVTVDVPGANTSGTGERGLVTDSRVGADFFNHLISLQNNLMSGNSTAIAATDRPALAKDEDNLLFHIGNIGATQSRLEAAATNATNQSLSLDQLVSNETHADLADSIMKLNQTQTAYQAALASGAGLLKMSLMDYLR